MSATLRFRFSGTSDRGNLKRRHVRKSAHDFMIDAASRNVFIVVIWIGVVNQKCAVVVFSRAGRVDKFTVHHVRACHDLRYVCRHIGDNVQHLISPIRHTGEASRDVFQDVPCLLSRLNVTVKPEAWFLAISAFTVWNKLVATLRDLVEFPLVKIQPGNAIAEAEALVRCNGIKHPGRIIRERIFKRSVPRSDVLAGYWIVIAWNLHLQTVKQT